MTESPARDRVILCHFNSYSVMLQIARFGPTILFPELPAEVQGPEAIGRSLAECLAIDPRELTHEPEFAADLDTTESSARVHLYRVRTIDPPVERLEAYAGKWRQLSELRGIARHELEYAKRVFNLNMGT